MNSNSSQPSLNELISLKEAAELSGLSASHLAALAPGNLCLDNAVSCIEHHNTRRRPPIFL